MGAPRDHVPVLFEEALEALAISPSGIYMDGTFGRGGHSGAIMQRLGGDGRLLAIDKDPEAVAHAEQVFSEDKRFSIKHGSFAMLEQLAQQSGVAGNVNGLLLDLGVSSPQLDDPARGFSFLRDGPLDMRMNPEQGMDAAMWLSKVNVNDLANVLRTYGEERYAKRIARAIVRTREIAPIKTTKQLADVIARANPSREKHKHPATRSFQAIRIFINRELEELQTCLEQCLEVLVNGGRLVVISFHSLEDRMVKQFIRKNEREEGLSLSLPVSDFRQRLKRIGRAIKPSLSELRNNPRARSAVLRIAERVS